MVIDEKDESKFWSYTAVCEHSLECKQCCWEWLASVDKDKYGKFCVKGKTLIAHRISYIMFYGSLPNGKRCICHKCDNPRCVNPHHLWGGSDKENVMDKMNKGRHRL